MASGEFRLLRPGGSTAGENVSYASRAILDASAHHSRVIEDSDAQAKPVIGDPVARRQFLLLCPGASAALDKHVSRSDGVLMLISDTNGRRLVNRHLCTKQ